MKVIIETKRLLLRSFNEEDAALLFELNRDPEVTRYTGDPLSTPAEAKQVLYEVILPQYALYHHGRWATHLKSTLEFIGWCGLKCRPERKEIDLGYRFMKKFWGNGYATESALASLQYGFRRFDFPKIIGRALPGNLSSVRVLEKCGMQYLGEELIDDWLHKTYQATNPAIKE